MCAQHTHIQSNRVKSRRALSWSHLDQSGEPTVWGNPCVCVATPWWIATVKWRSWAPRSVGTFAAVALKRVQHAGKEGRRRSTAVFRENQPRTRVVQNYCPTCPEREGPGWRAGERSCDRNSEGLMGPFSSAGVAPEMSHWLLNAGVRKFRNALHSLFRPSIYPLPLWPPPPVVTYFGIRNAKKSVKITPCLPHHLLPPPARATRYGIYKRASPNDFSIPKG